MVLKLVIALIWLTCLVVWVVRQSERITEERVMRRLEADIFSERSE